MHPAKLAFASETSELTFGQLDELTERLGAALLGLGLEPGDRAIFQLGTSMEAVVVLYACYKVGIIPVCSLPQHREVEIGHLAKHSGARAYFVQADFGRSDLVAFAKSMRESLPDVAHLIVVRGISPGLADVESLIAGIGFHEAREALAGVRIGVGDVLSFQLSGGTTGMPKIIPRFHGEYLGHSLALVERYGMSGDDRMIWSLPIIHNAGQLYALIPPVIKGMTSVLMARVDVAAMLDLIGRYQVTHALSIGPVAPQLLAYNELGRHDVSSLKLFATMSRADVLERHLGLPCSNLYGLTEGLLFGTAPDAPVFARHHTQGTSGSPDDELRLLDPDSEEPVPMGTMGELCFRGPSSLRGYYNDPAANAHAFTSEGFYRTGDMMTAHDVDGVKHYTFEGRLRDNINRGGEKIGCEEVEAFVCRHPAIADAKLVAMPDPIYGEKGCIFIVARDPAAAPGVEALSEFLVGEGLAKYKSPERVELIDVFPITKVGKLDKGALRTELARRMSLGKAVTA
jgi:non-ribosomal peptide synthetase component E (peptide arylation enzyme)